MADSARVARGEERRASVVSIRDLQTRCSRCDIRELCLPVGLDDAALRQLDHVVRTRRRVKRGESLFHAGDPFAELFAVRVGTFKITILAYDGREQITGYQMSGDLVGLDGISTGRHQCNAIALRTAKPA